MGLKQFPYRPLQLFDENGELVGMMNPYPNYDIDQNGNVSLNTVFGEKVVGVRKAQISAQFQYGIKEGDSSTSIVSTGGVTIEESLLKISTGTAADGAAAIYSDETVRYVPGQEVYCFFTALFSEPAENSYQRVGLFDDYNGFYVGYHNTEFCFTRLREGVEYHTEIDLDEFEKKYGYRLDPAMGNVYKISYGYLGFATITVTVMTPDGTHVVLSKIKYPNNYSVTHTTQTFLPVRGEVANTGNTTNLVVASGSLSAGIVDGGSSLPAARQFSYKNDTVYSVSANTVLVGFRIRDTFFGIDNKVPGDLLYISSANETSRPLRWVLLQNPTITNTPTWNYVDENNSVVEYSTDIQINFASGTTMMAWNTAKSGGVFEDVTNYDISMRPGGIAVFTVFAPTGTTGDADLSIRWRENF